MVYTISDIHGKYDKYIEMIEKINLKDDDVLYILGDVVDRGPQPMDVLLDMMNRKNVIPIFGNHEILALPVLEGLIDFDGDADSVPDYVSGDLKRSFDKWRWHGSETTIGEFLKLPYDTRKSIVDYLKSFKRYELIQDKEGDKILLLHAGLGNYEDNKPLDAYTDYELTFIRPLMNGIIYGDFRKIIVGHIPTIFVNQKAEMYSSGNMLFIDCGASYNGRLCCLCIDAMKAFYV